MKVCQFIRSSPLSNLHHFNFVARSFRRSYVSSSFSSSTSSSVLPQVAMVARYEKNGGIDVVQVRQEALPSLSSPKGVLVKMLFAPVNTLDLQAIAGNIPNPPALLPAIGGSEGLGQVVAVGDKTTLKVGDLVFPSKPFFGTWRNYACCDESELMSLPTSAKDVPQEYLSTLSLAPFAAYRLLNDYANLKEGDVIIQNGANSMVGLTLIQLAHARGIKTINIIRRRSDYADRVTLMKDYGAYIVCGDDYVRTAEFRSVISDIPKPKLALNGVGGDTVTEFARLLAPGGTLVTYSGASLKPVTVPTSSLIFNDLTLRGFNLLQWLSSHSTSERADTLKQLITAVQQKKLRLWVERLPFSDLQTALHRAEKTSERSRKVLLSFV